MATAIYHHEWWNGNGYPFGIDGKKIPLIARITSTCDAYDAMTSQRTYRHAPSHDYACQELSENAKTQFDPFLVSIFLNHEAEFLKLSKDVLYADSKDLFQLQNYPF